MSSSHLSRPEQPPLSPPDDAPPKRMRSDDAEAIWDALLDANARYLAELKQRPAWNVDCALERFRADSARGF